MNLSLFVLICSPPPRSTLFPYTTLFRSAGGRGPGRSAPRARAPLGRRCLRLDAQDLLERGAAHLELLVRRLARAEQPLDLVTRAAQQTRRGRARVALGPDEHLHGERQRAEADQRVGGRTAESG